jgi:hypothetical protein
MGKRKKGIYIYTVFKTPPAVRVWYSQEEQKD